MSDILAALGLTDAERATIDTLYPAGDDAETFLRRVFREDIERRAAAMGQAAVGKAVGQAVTEAQAALPTIFDTGE